MTDDVKMALEEYKMLRKEIDDKINTINTLNTAMIAAVWLIIAAGFKENHRSFFVLAELLIIPLYSRIIYYDRGIARISAYMIVFLEPKIGIKWETRNRDVAKKKIIDKYVNNKYDNILPVYTEGIFLLIISVVSWLILTCRNKWLPYEITALELIPIALGIYIIVTEFRYDIQFHRGNKGNWTKIWKKLKMKTLI